MREGVVKFEALHREAPLAAHLVAPVLAELAGWRALFRDLGIFGQEPTRYEGAAFGNLSARVEPFDAGPGRRAFVITGTQTSGRPSLAASDLALVTAYDYEHNRVHSTGVARPSSESMTHGAIYDLSPATRVVLHVHASVLWRQAAALGLPTSRPDVAYGTPAMALEVLRLFRTTGLRRVGVLAMGGHEDGVIAFGTSGRAAGEALTSWMAQALAREQGHMSMRTRVVGRPVAS